MKIHVTQEHIDLGRQEDLNYCAVALAIRDVVKRGVSVEVNQETIEFEAGEKRLKTPSKVAIFIEDFDNNKDYCEPFSFGLRVPKQYVEVKEGGESAGI